MERCLNNFLQSVRLFRNFYICIQTLIKMSRKVNIQVGERISMNKVRNLGDKSPGSSSTNERGADQIAGLRELEGECRIDEFNLLRINYPKAIIFGILMTLSVVGLLLLKYFMRLRALLFYSSIPISQADEATHLFVEGSDHESICSLQERWFEGQIKVVFEFKHLRYELQRGEVFPIGVLHSEAAKLGQQAVGRGLASQEVAERIKFYGKNEHQVEVPHYFEYLFDTMTQPFFIFQYLVSTIYILENVAIFGVLMIAFGFITTSINYVLLYRSYQKIKESAEKQFDVSVFRDGHFKIVPNVDLVCGDIFIPVGEIPCDAILVSGELFIDEANLTGQTVPIPKFRLEEIGEVQQKKHWVFEGSLVKTKREGTLAVAVDVGFGSKRGRIIRKILTKKPKQPEFFMKMIYFLLEVLVVSMAIYGGTVRQMFGLNIEKIMIFFRFLDFITYSFPAPMPIFFNLAYSFCLVRLRKLNIFGTQAEKTIQSARLKTICFDKTGTLTHPGMRVANIYNALADRPITDTTEKLPALVRDIFGCCNSVQRINGNYEGDEIDLKMFNHVNAQITKQPIALPTEIIRCIQVDDRIHQVLRINEYESRFQSMSVLYRHRQSKRYYIVGKGSPQMIHSFAQAKVKDYDAFIKKLSLQGFRSIAFGWREVAERDIAALMKADRQSFLKGINMLGVVAFVNLLKEDAQSTIGTLTEAEINTKIITGDNIFLGVQTALLTGMIPAGTRIMVVEGAKFNRQRAGITELIKLPSGQITQSQKVVQNFSFSDFQNVAYAIDNDFIKSNADNFLHNRVKVFARITPENKALIVRRHKQLIKSKIQGRSFWKRVFGECSVKVGMVGDGANDLIAIKDADVGIGISSSDAVYSASFAIKDLSQIIDIICDGKNTEQQIVGMTQYFMVVNFLYIISTVILTVDVAYTTSTQQIYKNFVTTLLLTLFFSLSKPSGSLTKYLPNSNFMGLQHHLVFWSSCIFLSGGLVIGYFYYYNCNDFLPNPQPVVTFENGWNGLCKSATVDFLIIQLMFILLPCFIYRSAPWSQPIYKNIALTILLCINILLIIPIYFLTPYLSFLDLSPIAQTNAAIIFAITLASCFLCGITNWGIERCQFHESVTLEDMVDMDISEDTKISQ